MMNSVFAIRDDSAVFQELDLELLDVLQNVPDNIPLDDVKKFNLKNTSMSSWWKTPDTDFISLVDKNAPIPDITKWVRSTLVLSPKAYRLLGDLLLSSGELLPVTVGDETYYIFNCLAIGDVDEENCTFEDNPDIPQKIVSHLTFKESVEDKIIFKTPLESSLTLFCSNRFKDAVKSFDLSGVVFDENLIEAFD